MYLALDVTVDFAFEPWKLALAISISGSLVTLIVHFLGPLLIKRAAVAIGIEPTDGMRLFQFPLVATVALGTLWATLQPLPIERVEPWITALIITFIIIIWVRGILKLGNLFIESTIHDEDDTQDVVPILENVWTFIVILLSIFIVLSAWDVDVTPLLASAGVAGVIIGLAARETVENFFGSIALYADSTYQTGDFIELDDDVRGWVRDISIRSTVLHTLDGDSVTIPNAKLHKSIIRNKSTPNQAFRVPITIGVSYDADPTHVREVLEETVESVIDEESSLILDNPQPQVHLREFEDSAVKFEILVWIELPNQRPKIQDKLNKDIYDALEQEGIEIPYPQRALHFAEKFETTSKKESLDE